MIEVGGEITERDSLRSQALHARSYLVRAVLLMVALLLALALVLVILAGVSAAQRMLLPIGLAFVIALPLAFVFRNQLLKRTYRKQPSLQGEHAYRFSEEGISATSPLAQGEIEWRVYTSWREDEELFLLYQASKLFDIVPKHWFGGDEQRIRALRALLEERVSGDA